MDARPSNLTALPTPQTPPPSVPGVVDGNDLVKTARSIADLQLRSGMIQWYPGGHTDPWNHVESAMALTTCGFLDEAGAAYRWLIDIQRPDGSWHNYYTADGVSDAKLDTNCVAYLATGVWHYHLATDSLDLAAEAWPTIDAAIEFVLSMQTERGEIVWARHTDHSPWDYALLTGSSSIGHSLACAIDLSQALGHDRPRWVEARQRLVSVIATSPEAFEPKDRWAMDWYYPVLTGAIDPTAGAERIRAGWDTFVMEGKGVRCVSDEPWVTAAETCECVMACLAAGLTDEANALYRWAQHLRHDDGSYFTGMVYPERVHFPADERSTYTSAAVILAADALEASSPTASLFVDHGWG